MENQENESENERYQQKFEDYEGCFLFKPRVSLMPLIRGQEVDEDDIYVCSFPKSGTTWLQQIVYLIRNGADIKEAKQTPLDERFPFVERSHLEGQTEPLELPQMTPPRLFKSHLPYHLLPGQLRQGKGKMIYIARNPKDVLVSFYFHIRKVTFYLYRGEMDELLDLFVNDSNPSVCYGPWWKHVLGYWSHANDENLLFLTYEELKKDLAGGVRRIAKFLNKPLSGAQVETISNCCTFDSMRKDETVNRDDVQFFKGADGQFLRKGQVGDWKNHFTEKMNEKMEAYEQRHLSESGLKFVHE